MRSRLRYPVAAHAGRALLNALFATARYEIGAHDEYRALADAGRPCILVTWHGRLLPLTYLHRGRGIATLASRSADGEYIARLLTLWGYEAVRGSSSRGGSRALRDLVRHARAGRTVAFTPDGPRGPRQRMKPGAVTAARLTGLPLVPLTAGTARAWWFEGWDRFMVPKPFARIRVCYGAPQRVPASADADGIRAASQRLEAALNRLVARVDADDVCN